MGSGTSSLWGSSQQDAPPGLSQPLVPPMHYKPLDGGLHYHPDGAQALPAHYAMTQQPHPNLHDTPPVNLPASSSYIFQKPSHSSVQHMTLLRAAPAWSTQRQGVNMSSYGIPLLPLLSPGASLAPPPSNGAQIAPYTLAYGHNSYFNQKA